MDVIALDEAADSNYESNFSDDEAHYNRVPKRGGGGKFTRRRTLRRWSCALAAARAVSGGLQVVTLVRGSRSQGEFLHGLREGDRR